MSNVENKTVVITGASRGIGEAAAYKLAGLGAHVVLAARTERDVARIAHAIEAQGGQARSRACDVADYGNVADLIDFAGEAFGSVDVLVNNAGIIEPIARLADSDPAVWSQIADANFKGVYYGLHAALPVMLSQGSGTVINMSSGAATSALEGWSHYCSTKAAVLSLTRCADKEYREHGVNVIGLSPGTVATNMQKAIKASGINPVSRIDPSAHISPEWVAEAIHYLCGPEGAAYAGEDFSLKSNDGRRRVGLPQSS